MAGDEAPEATAQDVELRVKFHHSTVGPLLDTQSVLRDLLLALECLQALKVRPASEFPEEWDSTVRGALWNSAVISFRRAFTSGKSFEKGKPRASITEDDLLALTQGQTRTRVELLHEGDKHVAHRVDGEREQAWAEIELHPPDVPGIRYVTWAWTRRTGPTDDWLDRSIDLCEALISVVKIHRDDLNTQFSDSVAANLPKLYEQLGIRLPGSKDTEPS